MMQASEDSGVEIARLASDIRVLIGRLGRRLRQLVSADEISLSQVSVLSRLEHEGPATPGALASVEHVRPQSMCATLAALEQEGLVSRTADPTDGRRVVYTLTTAGDETIQGMRRSREEHLARALSEGLTPEERQILAAALPLLDRVIRLL
jgi:DNA-binding MarR family transcriptional regulator